MFKILLFSFFVSLCLTGVSQSVVHAESKRLNGEESGFSGNLEMGLSFVQNINDVFSSQNSSQLQWMKNKHNILSVNALNLTVFNGNKVLNDGMQHFRYGYNAKKWLTFEGFLQGQYNTIIKLKERYLLGIGARFNILDFERDSVRLFTGIHYMREYEVETTEFINRHHRISSVITFGWPITPNFEIDLVGYFQPDILNFSDFRISSEIFFKVGIIKKLKFKFSMAWFYDTQPPEDIRNIFYNIRNSILYEF